MTIFTLQVSTDNPMPLLHRRIPTPGRQQSHQELKATLGQGIFPVILGKMAQPGYFGPLAASPQVLFSNFCLKFLCDLQGWTAATA